jgi:hypothetical protein
MSFVPALPEVTARRHDRLTIISNPVIVSFFQQRRPGPSRDTRDENQMFSVLWGQ